MISLFSKIRQIINIVKIFNSSKNEYLWKLGHIRENKMNNIIGTYYDSYVLCNKLNYIVKYMIHDYINIFKIYKFDKMIIECDFMWLFTSKMNRATIHKNFSDNIHIFINLKELTLLYHNLTKLPTSINKLVNLKKLYLRGNSFHILSSTVFGELISLKQLSLLDSELISIPKTISKLTKLTHLNISRNKLKKLPCEISKLTNLIHLNTSRNRLRNLPSGIFELHNLKLLNIGVNQLKTLSSEIRKLRQLEELNIAYIACKIPNILNNFLNLKILKIDIYSYERYVRVSVNIKQICFI